MGNIGMSALMTIEEWLPRCMHEGYSFEEAERAYWRYREQWLILAYETPDEVLEPTVYPDLAEAGVTPHGWGMP